MSKKQGAGTSFYAVHKGYQPGVYLTWKECEQQVKGYPNPCFRKFSTEEEAQRFVRLGRENIKEDQASSSKPRATKKRERPSSREPSLPPLKEARTEGTEQLCVWTDGACIHNGYPNARTGIGVFFSEESPFNLSEPLPGEPQTNQRAELYAVIRALQQVREGLEGSFAGTKKLVVYSDSSYTVNIMNHWIHGWMRRSWKQSEGKPVKNKDLIQQLWGLHSKLKDSTSINTIEYIHVKGHAGEYGNTQADQLASLGISKRK
jgi:ribonuclease HI